MKLKAEILALENIGDQIKVVAKGQRLGAAEWNAELVWEFKVPEFIGIKYRIGKQLKIEVNPL